jgi:hypothetical protein
MEIADFVISDVMITQENSPRPDGRFDAGLVISFRIIPLDPNGNPLPLATRAYRLYYREDEIPPELADVLDRLFSLIRPPVDAIKQDIQQDAEPLRRVKLDKMIKEKRSGRGPVK